MKTLIDLLAEDGIEVNASGMALCPFHDDHHPSMHISPELGKGGRGLYHCHTCGEGGDAVKWLVKRRDMTTADALRYLDVPRDEQVGAPEPTKQAKPLVALPKFFTSRHEYRNADDQPHQLVFRFDNKSGKKYAQYRAAPHTKIGWEKGKPDNLLLYRLPQIIAQPNRPVLIVEGELCVETLEQLSGWASLATTWPGGCGGFKKTTGGFGDSAPVECVDLTVLEGRRVVLWPDNDAQGVAAMATLAKRLKNIASPQLIYLPKKLNKKFDVGFAIKEMNWDKEKISVFVGKYKRVVDEQPSGLPEPSEEDVANIASKSVESNGQFTVLGYFDESVVILIHSTGEVIRRKYTALSQSMVLFSIATKAFWLHAFEANSVSQTIRESIGAELIRVARERGMFDNSKESGRGVHSTDDGDVLHLGDRLMFAQRDTAFSLIDGPKPTVWRVEPAFKIAKYNGFREPLRDLCEALLEYRFKAIQDAAAFVGWMIAAPVAGALDYRPHVWISGDKDVGKTWLINQIIHKMMDGWLIHILAGTTPAGLRRELRFGTRPVLFDESEARGKVGQILAEEVAALMRVSTSGEGAIIMASEGSHGVVFTRPRASFMLSSMTQPRLDNATASRISVIRMSMEGVPNWPEVREAITLAMKKHRTIFAGILHSIGEIRAAIEKATAVIVDENEGQSNRDSQQRGALIGAMCWGMCNTPSEIKDYAREISDQFRAPRSLTESGSLLDEILAARVRTNSQVNPNMTIDAMVAEDAAADKKSERSWGVVLGQYGMRVSSKEFLVSPNSPALRGLLRGTAYASSELSAILMRHEGARLVARAQIGNRQFRNVIAIPLDEMDFVIPVQEESNE